METETTDQPLKQALVSSRVWLCIGNSRWTSENRNHAIHINAIGGNPLCGKNYKNGILDRYIGELSEVTCAKCKDKYGC